MDNRNRAVAYAAGDIKAKYDRLATVQDVVEATKLTPQKIYATSAYKEGKIAKTSAILTEEVAGGSTSPSEYFKSGTTEGTRAKQRTDADQAELDTLIDEQEKDDHTNRK